MDMIKTSRLREDIEALRQISDPANGGVTRIGFTPTYRLGVEYVKRRMQEIGLTVFEDEIGNVHGVLAGTDEKAPAIVTGSHLDTVRNAGAFDGIAGVVCALEVARQLQERHITLKHPFEIIGFIEEEGSSFGQVLLGSRFITGELTRADLSRFTRQDKATLEQVLPDYMRGIVTQAVRRESDEILAFLELHDEQGPLLDGTGTDIGIVESIVGIVQLTVTVTGFAGHAGTIPMDMRQDAGLAAFALITAMSSYVREQFCHKATLTVGKLQLLPNSSNCVPGECVFSIDLRSGDKTIIDRILAQIQTFAAQTESLNKVSIDIQINSRKEAVAMDSELQQMIAANCEKLGLSYRMLSSGAGHDAMIMATLCPTAMIFIPCEKGITHHPSENVTWSDMCKGTELLLETVLMLDSAKK